MAFGMGQDPPVLIILSRKKNALNTSKTTATAKPTILFDWFSDHHKIVSPGCLVQNAADLTAFVSLQNTCCFLNIGHGPEKVKHF